MNSAQWKELKQDFKELGLDPEGIQLLDDLHEFIPLRDELCANTAKED
jgi:hypothetical protein